MAGDASEALRAAVARRAGHRCEYCLIHESDGAFRHQLDHVLSVKHGGASNEMNLAFACVLCNRHKGSDVAAIDSASGRPVRLFNPRRDRWQDHFRFDGSTVEALSASGSATIRILRMNAPERIAERELLRALGRMPS